MEVMSLDEIPWKDNHRRYSFLPNFHMVEEQSTTIFSFDIVTNPQPPVPTHDVDSEDNLSNITKTIYVDISVKPGILEDI